MERCCYESSAIRLMATIGVGELFDRFRDKERFFELCRQCPNFGRSYLCPPLPEGAIERLEACDLAEIHVAKITPVEPRLPSSVAQDVMLPHIIDLEASLIESERRRGGIACGFGGKCRYCNPANCARLSGAPCRRADVVRPSLEAYGFDVGAIVRHLFGIEMLWGRDNLLPEYLLLVGAFFKNRSDKS